MKYSTGSRVFVLAAVLLTVASVSSPAQSNSYTRMLNTTMSATNSLFAAQTAVIQQRKSMAVAAGVWPAGTAPSTAQPAQPAAKQFPITATDFRSYSTPIMPDQLANAATDVDPQTREEMRKLFRQALISFESGARKNNLANAFAFITAVALLVKTGKEPTDPQTDFLIAYFNNILGASPEYSTYDAQRLQVLYESLIITGSMVALLDARAKQNKDAQLQTQVSEMSRVVIKQFLGIDAQ